MTTSDVHTARSEAKATVMEQLAHVKLITNSNKQYTHDEIMKVHKSIKRVLNDTYNEDADGKGMSELLDEAPNKINIIKTNQAVSYQTVLKQSIEDATALTKKAKAKDANAATIAPLIPDTEAARAEADRRNIHNQTIVGTKEGVILAISDIVGKHIINKVTMTADGSDKVSIDDYNLHDIMKCAIDHATRPEIDDVLGIMMSFYEFNFDFRNTVNQNMTALQEIATRLKQFGLSITQPEMTLVLLNNINGATKSR